jgi:hypothetical protein
MSHLLRTAGCARKAIGGKSRGMSLGIALAAAVVAAAVAAWPAITWADGISVNGAAPATGPVAGAASGNDTVTAAGVFSGSYSQNTANNGATETIAVKANADITPPDGLDYWSNPATQTIDGTNYTDDNDYYGLFEINQGTLTNLGTIDATFDDLPASTQLYGLDPYVGNSLAPAGNEDYNFGDGVMAWGTNVGWHGPTTITNGSASNSTATIRGAVTGSGQNFANGIHALEIYGNSAATNLTVNNYGAVDGEVDNYDGTAAGVNAYCLFGGLAITNYAKAMASATAPFYTTGIYGAVYFGDTKLVNNGAATATAGGGAEGYTKGLAYAAGVDLFGYAGNVTATNSGKITGSISGGSTSVCYGMFLWAEGGNNSGGAMTLANSGTIAATNSSGPGGAAKAVYCGGNGAAQTVVNSGTITGTAGQAGGWALGVEDDQSDPINITNSGAIKHNNGLGVAVFAGSGLTTIRNTGTIYGGLLGISAETFNGPITIYDHGSVGCLPTGGGAMGLGNGNNTVYFYGLPSVSGSIIGGSGANTLHFHLTGQLQKVNGKAATLGPNLTSYKLGSSGSIVVSGKTYSWSNFAASGSTAANTIKNGKYEIVNRWSGLALEASAGGTAPGTQIDQAAYTGAAGQQWTVTKLAGGEYEITGVATGESINSGGAADGSKITLQDFEGTSDQMWILTPTDSGYYTITPAAANGYCLDVDGASQSSGAIVQLWMFDDADAYAAGFNQQWGLSLVR